MITIKNHKRLPTLRTWSVITSYPVMGIRLEHRPKYAVGLPTHVIWWLMARPIEYDDFYNEKQRENSRKSYSAAYPFTFFFFLNVYDINILSINNFFKSFEMITVDAYYMGRIIMILFKHAQPLWFSWEQVHYSLVHGFC